MLSDVMPSVVILSDFMLGVVNAHCRPSHVTRYAERRYAENLYAESLYAESLYASSLLC
jgi:hypothetical protein